MQAPPIPMRARAPISMCDEVLKAASAEKAPNSARPVVKMPLRPSLSPSEPAVSRRQAKTIVYPPISSCSSEPLALRLSTIDGSATLRIVLSMLMTVRDRHSTASVHQRRSWARGEFASMCPCSTPTAGAAPNRSARSGSGHRGDVGAQACQQIAQRGQVAVGEALAESPVERGDGAEQRPEQRLTLGRE